MATMTHNGAHPHQRRVELVRYNGGCYHTGTALTKLVRLQLASIAFPRATNRCVVIYTVNRTPS